MPQNYVHYLNFIGQPPACRGSFMGRSHPPPAALRSLALPAEILGPKGCTQLPSSAALTGVSTLTRPRFVDIPTTAQPGYPEGAADVFAEVCSGGLGPSTIVWFVIGGVCP